jgi:hypothetical protein
MGVFPGTVRALVILIVACQGICCQDVSAAMVGDRVPDFAFEKVAVIDDGSTRFEQWIGQPILFEFWGTR